MGQFPAGYRGFATDVGANDGVFLSTTLPLEQAGWRVLCIEPNPHYEAALRQNRREVLRAACAAADAKDQPFYLVKSSENRWASYSALHPAGGDVSEVVRVDVRRLDACLSEAGFPRLDFLTVDAEGGDMAVLQGFDLTTWHPRVIVVENWSGDNRFVTYLDPHGYRLTARDDPNEVFCATDPSLEVHPDGGL